MAAGIWLCAWPARVQALEQTFEDLSASVEVAPIFEFTVDNPHLAFGEVSPGTTAMLGEGGYFNEVTCRSNSGRPWYLKAQLVALKAVGQPRVLPPERLEWRIVDSTGSAELGQARSTFQPFAEQPVLLYRSQGRDNKGRPVSLRFQYTLTAAPDAPAGGYLGEIIYTMVESP